MAEIWGAEEKTRARLAARRFADLYGAKFGKVVDELEVLLAFYDFPPSAGCTCHLEPDQSTFATVRHGTRVTKGPCSRAAAWP